MDIKHIHKATLGAFVVEIDGHREAEMVYKMNTAETMTIVHTQVSDTLKGKSVGMQLVRAGVDYARQNNLKVIPECPFVRSVFEKVEAFRDVLL